MSDANLKRRRQENRGAEVGASPKGGSLNMRKLSVGLAVAALCVAMLVAWGIPRPLGDLYLALAGGRDVLHGKLGKPDGWSYTTGGRVWVNSSWGSDVVFALVERAGGEAGLLALKALLLVALGLLVMRAARAGGASPVSSLAVAALALVSSPQDLILRPNLISLLFVPALLLLLATPVKGKTWLIWIGVLFLCWTNLHGAFVFGLLVLGIWVLTTRTSPRRIAFAAMGSALLIALVANPFGPRNLWLQLVVPRSAAWRNVIEWGPLWGQRPPGVAFPVLFVVLAAIALLGLFRRRSDRTSNLFELSLVIVGIVLALGARRLVPWTAVAIAPAAARALDALVPQRRNAAAFVLANAGLIIFLLAANKWVPAHYARNHPLFPNESVLDRMVFHGTHFPGGAAEFLAANHVARRAFNEWRWEGYLREYAPGITVMIGGRAHQVYDEATYWKYRDFLAGSRSRTDLESQKVALAVVPLTPEYGNFCRTLLREPGAWSYIYADRYTAIFANPSDPATQDLVRRAGAGELTYPDSASATLSRAMCLSSPGTADPVQALALLQRALALRPTSYAYPVLVRAAIKTEVPRESLIGYLEQEDARLDRISHGAPEENALLDCRLYILQELERLYPSGATDKKQHLAAERIPIESRMRVIASAYPSYFR